MKGLNRSHVETRFLSTKKAYLLLRRCIPRSGTFRSNCCSSRSYGSQTKHSGKIRRRMPQLGRCHGHRQYGVHAIESSRFQASQCFHVFDRGYNQEYVRAAQNVIGQASRPRIKNRFAAPSPLEPPYFTLSTFQSLGTRSIQTFRRHICVRIDHDLVYYRSLNGKDDTFLYLLFFLIETDNKYTGQVHWPVDRLPLTPDTSCIHPLPLILHADICSTNGASPR